MSVERTIQHEKPLALSASISSHVINVLDVFTQRFWKFKVSVAIANIVSSNSSTSPINTVLSIVEHCYRLGAISCKYNLKCVEL